jgi:2-phosphoglycerate kinase
MNNHLQQLFSQAYILGGSPCSGKSTIAEMLTAKYSIQYYKADDHDPEHMQRAAQDQQPIMIKYSKMNWDQIWSQSVDQLLQDEIGYYHERFPFILDDLSKLNLETPVILEGAAFLPELINSYPVNRRNVVFMIPTLEFQRHHYAQRSWAQSILQECHDPKQAFDNWMQRDTSFGENIMKQANIDGFRVIVVDGHIDVPRQLETIRTQFGLVKAAPTIQKVD